MKVKLIPMNRGVRCIAWLACPIADCDHHSPHAARMECILLNQVKYCPEIEGFVTDMPLTDFDSALANDPNLAFKAQRDSHQ